MHISKRLATAIPVGMLVVGWMAFAMSASSHGGRGDEAENVFRSSLAPSAPTKSLFR